MNLRAVKGVGNVLAEKFEKLGITTVDELLLTLPKSYVDMDAAFSLDDALDGDFCSFCGELIELGRPFKQGKLTILHGKALSQKTEIKLVFYNQNYYAKTLKIGEKYIFFGKIKKAKTPVFVNPKVDLVGSNKLVGIHPIYRTKGTIPQGTYSNVIKEALPFFTPQNVIDPELEKQFGLLSFYECIKNVHFPQKTDLSVEKRRIILEKTVKRICAFRYAKAISVQKRSNKKYSNVDFTPLFSKLPFVLSESQKNALKKLTEVLIEGGDMNAILCGDVGSGKTIVAVALCYFVIKNGYKALFMAPTSILAKQHYSLLKSLFSDLDINVGFLIGDTKKREKEEIYNLSGSGVFDIVVGTHSLFNSDLIFPDLGLIVTDEQHRFGVAQRTRLISKGQNAAVLTMSATPIPRSLRLIAYGEVEYLMVERPRKSKVKTRIVTSSKRADMWEYVNSVLSAGRQVYVIAPRIFDNEGMELDSVETLYEELSLYIPEEKIGVLHGKMKGEDKQKVLDDFYQNEKGVLLSTTVVEVGIDVPNATVMVICDADRFGLATLHQLRGRIGRGDEDGYCFLYTDKEPSDGLKALVKCSSGIEIAEKDFELRGGGDIFGLDQSGSESLEGLTLSVLKESSQIADKVDLFAVKSLLYDEIKSFSLSDVSLT